MGDHLRQIGIQRGREMRSLALIASSFAALLLSSSIVRADGSDAKYVAPPPFSWTGMYLGLPFRRSLWVSDLLRPVRAFAVRGQGADARRIVRHSGGCKWPVRIDRVWHRARPQRVAISTAPTPVAFSAASAGPIASAERSGARHGELRSGHRRLRWVIIFSSEKPSLVLKASMALPMLAVDFPAPT